MVSGSAVTTAAATAATAAVLYAVWRRRQQSAVEPRVDYDEMSMFHENCTEWDIPFPPGGPVVSRERAVLSDGREISALKWGSAPPELVLLHGGAQNAHTWDTVALALGRPLVALDLPSHGHSDSAAKGVNSPVGAAADIAEALEQLAPAAKLVVGMSFGGLTAIALSARRPELVRRLALVDITPGVNRGKAQHIVDFVKGPESFASFQSLLTRTRLYNPTRSESSLRRGILHNAMQREDGSWVWRHARFRESDISQAQAHGATFDYSKLWDDLGALNAPCMLVRGLRRGSVVDDADEAELRRRQPAARVDHVKEAGHSVQGDQPIELARLLESFLDAK